MAAALLLTLVAKVELWRPELSGLVRLCALALVIATAWRVRIVLRLRQPPGKTLPTTPMLRFARAMRTSTTVAANPGARRIVRLAYRTS